MEKYIIFIILIIFILIILSKKNEKLTIDDSKSSTINTVVGKFFTTELSKIPNINISSSLKVSGINFDRVILNYKYPVGSFYVQYPDSNVTFSAKGDTPITPFPESKTPAKMFGGKWIDMWKDESVYFRTGTLLDANNKTSPAFEDVHSCEGVECGSRVDGFQDYAYMDLSGWTNVAQAARGSGTVNNPAQCEGNTGVFSKCEKIVISADSGGGNGKGLQNIFDTTSYLKDKYPSTYSNYTSDFEVRVKNRLIKVWKRIA